MKKLSQVLLSCAVLVAALAACDENSGMFSQLRSELRVETRTLVMGQRYLGARATAVFDMHNPGNAAVTAALEVQGDGATAYVVDPKVVVNADSSRTVRVDFVPDREGPLEAILVIAHDADSRSPLWVTLSGSGQATPSCDDGNPCTENWFDLQSETCRSQARNGSCDDRNACTEGDTCVEGQCIGRSIECWDLTDCTLDTCDPNQGCLFVPQHDTCADQDPCSDDVCHPLLGCLNPPQPEGTLCGTPSCEEFAVCIAGQCIRGATPDGFPCEDGDVCTSGDTCQSGICEGGEGQPFGVISPVEVATSSSDGSELREVLAVAPTALDGLQIVYHTEVTAPPPCDCADPDCLDSDGDAICECCACPSFGGGEVRVATATASGVVLEDRILTRAIKARAQILDGQVFLAALHQGDGGCGSPTQSLRLRRFDAQWQAIDIAVVPPDGADAQAFDLASNGDEIALAQLFQVTQSSCGGRGGEIDCAATVEPTTVYNASVIRFTRELALIGERVVGLASAPAYGVRDLVLQYRAAALDIGFIASVDFTEQCNSDPCSGSCWIEEARLATDVLNEMQGPGPVINLGDSATALSTVIATYPAGAFWVSGYRDMTQNGSSTDSNADPDPGAGAEPPGPDQSDSAMIGNACAPYEQVRLYSGAVNGAIEQVIAVDHTDQQRLTAVEAIAAMGRLGVVTLDYTGKIEAVVPPSGFVPEVRLDLSFPAESPRRWFPYGGLISREVGRGVYAAGISEDDPGFLANCDPMATGGVSEEEDGRSSERFLPGCFPQGKRVVVAGAGCGIGEAGLP